MADKRKNITRASARAKSPTLPTTRTTRARTATATATARAVATVPKKTAARKPLVSKENSDEATVTKSKPTTTKKGKQLAGADREAIMAYLRIRPHIGEAEHSPYLTPLSDTSVRMTDPQDHQNPSRFRSSTLPPSSIYTFSHIFPPDTNQSDFFTKTTLPLVHDVLQGQNALLFTYGVTNSGKTYTIQGGSQEGSAGILPRTLDVIFNSIDGLHGDGKFRPVRLHGIEPADVMDSKPPLVMPEPAIVEVLGHLDTPAVPETDIDSTALKVDRNFEYTIWLSYAEVYNEKVYDLLASVNDNTNGNLGAPIPRTGSGKSLLLTRKALPLKPSPYSDGADDGISGRYISGLRQFRVHRSSQAKDLVKLGQLHRRVFGTLANRESSRSHGMVIIRVVRGHRGERDDPTALQVSRLTLVDLAGSERTKHTHTTGERLREAGNINKSLMVLGQCMEVMRSNQRKVAMSLSHEGLGKESRVDTRDVKKTLAVVPFRHSKLTEALMDYFIGDGRAVMIVNVNPYDTGYDENSHVMKFAALAREVYITPALAPLQRVQTMTGLGKTQGSKIKELGPLTLKDPGIIPHPYRRKVTISMEGSGVGIKPKETILEVLEEDETKDPNDGDESEDDEPINPLVDALFDEVEDLRMQLFESEMRCAVIEAETREEVMREMEERMRSMEQIYSRRLMNELKRNERKNDAKIDMLHQAGLFASPAKRGIPIETGSSDDEMDSIHYRDSEDPLGESDCDDHTTTLRNRRSSPSPLANKRGKAKVENPDSMVMTGKHDRKNFNNDRREVTNMDNEESVEILPRGGINDDKIEVEVDEDEDDCYNSEGEDWSSPASFRRNKSPKYTPQNTSRSGPSSQQAQQQLMKLGRCMNDLSLSGDIAPDDSIVIMPVRKPRRNQQSSPDDSGQELPEVKKKKRQLGKKPVMTEEDIQKITDVVENQTAKREGIRTVRRLVGK